VDRHPWLCLAHLSLRCWQYEWECFLSYQKNIHIFITLFLLWPAFHFEKLSSVHSRANLCVEVIEIQSIHPEEPNPIFWWNINELTAIVIYDIWVLFDEKWLYLKPAKDRTNSKSHSEVAIDFDFNLDFDDFSVCSLFSHKPEVSIAKAMICGPISTATTMTCDLGMFGIVGGRKIPRF
jgi:hypothetical protein